MKRFTQFSLERNNEAEIPLPPVRVSRRFYIFFMEKWFLNKVPILWIIVMKLNFLYLQKFTSVFKQSAGHRTVRQYLKPFVIFTNLKNIYQYIILEVDSTFLS